MSTRASRSFGISPSFEIYLDRTRAGLRFVGGRGQSGHGVRKSFRLDFVLRRRRSASGHRAAHRRFPQARLRSNRDGLAASAAFVDAAFRAARCPLAQRPGGSHPIVRLLPVRGDFSLRRLAPRGAFVSRCAGVARAAGAQSESSLSAGHSHDRNRLPGGVNGSALLHGPVSRYPIVRVGSGRGRGKRRWPATKAGSSSHSSPFIS